MKKTFAFAFLLVGLVLVSGCGNKVGTPVNGSPANTDTMQATTTVDGCGNDTNCAEELLANCEEGKFNYNGYQFNIQNKITAGCVTSIERSQTGGQARCLLPLGISQISQLDTLISGDEIQLADKLVTGICNPILNTI